MTGICGEADKAYVFLDLYTAAWYTLKPKMKTIFIL